MTEQTRSDSRLPLGGLQPAEFIVFTAVAMISCYYVFVLKNRVRF